MNRAPMNISTVCEAVWMIAPATTISAPMKMVLLRPRPSHRYGVNGREPREPMFWMAPSKPSLDPLGKPNADSHWSMSCRPSVFYGERDIPDNSKRQKTYSSCFHRSHSPSRLST